MSTLSAGCQRLIALTQPGQSSDRIPDDHFVLPLRWVSPWRFGLGVDAFLAPLSENRLGRPTRLQSDWAVPTLVRRNICFKKTALTCL
jgi:hypothetical protein